MTATPAIARARGVTKSFTEGRGTVPVLRGIDIELHRGEIVALEGPSGSGKTTLLSILGCILTPTGGTVEIDGNPVDPRRPELLAGIRRRSIGFVFQQYNLFPTLNARENVELALNVKGVVGAAARRESERAIDLVGLAGRANALPRDLSGGQKQRVAVARAIAGSPAILLADEPTANLDTENGEQILALFRDLVRRDGRALLVVTHDREVRTYADRVVGIRDGRLHDPGA